MPPDGPPPPRDVDATAQWYAAREREARTGLARASRRASRLSIVRLALGVAVAIALWLAVDGGAAAMGWGMVGLAALCYAVAAWQNGRARVPAEHAAPRAGAARRGQARLRREWGALPAPARTWGPVHPLAEDLDLWHADATGPTLARLLDVVTPAVGAPTLRAWLLAAPPAREEILGRQQVVAELRGRADTLLAWAAEAAAARHAGRGPLDAFVAWAVDDAADSRWRRAALAPLLVPVGAVAALALGARNVNAYLAALPLLVALLANVALVIAAQGPLGHATSRVGDLLVALRPVRALLGRFVALELASPRARELQARMRGGDRALARLERLLAWADVRANPLLHWALVVLVAWDAQLAAALERWRARHGGEARRWIDAVGEAEALVALATLAHDQPDWVLPEVVPDDVPPESPLLVATALAHPLLPPGRIANDVAVGGAGAVLVVSGSNMAGKSTLLRAVGLAMLMGQMGGPVCARAARLRRARTWTSVRVHDAIGRGVSLYLAELERLRDIVAAAGEPGPPLLFLLDEVLHGTNSADRRTATQAVLERLAARGASGVITTHDLALAAPDALRGARVRAVHFRDEVRAEEGGARMTFDYRVREGPATSANALALLAALGLGPEG